MSCDVYYMYYTGIVDSTWFVPRIKFGERNFFWAWYQLKLICVLYFHFVPSPEKVSLANFFPERGGGTNQVESTIAKYPIDFLPSVRPLNILIKKSEHVMMQKIQQKIPPPPQGAEGRATGFTFRVRVPVQIFGRAKWFRNRKRPGQSRLSMRLGERSARHAARYERVDDQRSGERSLVDPLRRQGFRARHRRGR